MKHDMTYREMPEPDETYIASIFRAIFPFTRVVVSYRHDDATYLVVVDTHKMFMMTLTSTTPIEFDFVNTHDDTQHVVFPVTP